MSGDIKDSLRRELRDREYAEGYAESFLNAFIATQIKVIREQRGMTQADLGKAIGTTQAGVSRIEDVNYSSWNIRTLAKLARAFDIRLRVSFETYGTLPIEVVGFNRESLERVDRPNDPGLADQPSWRRQKMVNIAEFLAGRGQSETVVQSELGQKNVGGFAPARADAWPTALEGMAQAI